MDVIKSLKQGKYAPYLGEFNVIKIVLRGPQESSEDKIDMLMETEAGLIYYEHVRRVHKPRYLGSHWK